MGCGNTLKFLPDLRRRKERNAWEESRENRKEAYNILMKILEKGVTKKRKVDPYVI